MVLLTRKPLLVSAVLLLAPTLASAGTYSYTVADQGDASSCNAAQSSLSSLTEVSFSVHRNGDPKACGVTAAPSLAAMTAALQSHSCASGGSLTKFQVESFLSDILSSSFTTDCGSIDDANALEGLLGHCDMGPERTVIEPDHDSLVRVPSSGSLPCRWFTREGLRILSLEQLSEMADAASAAQDDCSPDAGSDETKTCAASSNTLQLYAVPAGRVFMFAPSFVGETFELNHVQDTDGKTVVLKVLSLEPRVFDIYNFFNQQESTALVEKALSETTESHKFHRSTTGTSGAAVFNKRTSENAWDTHGKTARIVKQRCFSLLGFDEYIESHADGLQILRYNLTTAYTPHMDYLEDRGGKESYDYDSSGKGGNRFATILMYFSDLSPEDGGETVFPKAWPANVAEKDRVELPDAIQQLRDSGDAPFLEQGSWEEEMTAQCRTRFSVRPHATRAVLFYSQFPNGEQDPMSFHGGCPVLSGSKLAANLWTWSGIRPEYDGAPRKFEEAPKATPGQIKAVFRNSGADARFKNAEVYYDEDGFFGKLGFGDDPVRVNTYLGHVWNIKVDGKTLHTFVINNGAEQEFVV